MPNYGPPISTDKQPNKLAIIGPIVDPHLESQLTINSLRGTSHFLAIVLIIDPEIASVVYLPLQFLFKTIPLLIFGLWFD